MKKINKGHVRGYLFSLGLAIFTYFFYGLIINNDEEYFTLPLEVITPSQYAPASEIESSVTVTVKGSPASLARISRDDMRTRLDLRGTNVEGITNYAITLERFGVFGQINNVEVTMIPNSIEVLMEDRISKSIAIEPAYINSLPKGYLLDGYRVEPAKVEISGPKGEVATLDMISSTPIDLSLLTQSGTRVAPLIIPKFITLQSLLSNEVEVYTEIEEVMSVRNFASHEVVVRNVNAELQYSFEEGNRVSLVVQGPQLQVEKLNPEVFIDVSTVRQSGIFSFDVQTLLPEDIEIISISPRRKSLLFVPLSSIPDNRDLEETLPSPDFVPLGDQENIPIFTSPSLTPS